MTNNIFLNKLITANNNVKECYLYTNFPDYELVNLSRAKGNTVHPTTSLSLFQQQ